MGSGLGSHVPIIWRIHWRVRMDSCVTSHVCTTTTPTTTTTTTTTRHNTAQHSTTPHNKPPHTATHHHKQTTNKPQTNQHTYQHTHIPTHTHTNTRTNTHTHTHQHTKCSQIFFPTHFSVLSVCLDMCTSGSFLSQIWCVHLIILPTHPRWLKAGKSHRGRQS